MNGRFLNQINLLDKNKDRKTGVFAGFATMALDCLLMETLEQFINGRIRTDKEWMNHFLLFCFLLQEQRLQFSIIKLDVAFNIKLKQKGNLSFR